jgi:hypothetical protein
MRTLLDKLEKIFADAAFLEMGVDVDRPTAAVNHSLRDELEEDLWRSPLPGHDYETSIQRSTSMTKRRLPCSLSNDCVLASKGEVNPKKLVQNAPIFYIPSHPKSSRMKIWRKLYGLEPCSSRGRYVFPPLMSIRSYFNGSSAR